MLKQAITEIWVMGWVARKPKVVAFQQQRRRPAWADAQSEQRLCCSISGKYNWFILLYTQNLCILANLCNRAGWFEACMVIFQSHGNFCDPVLFCFFLLIILKFKKLRIHIMRTSWAHVYSVKDIQVLPVPI